MKVLFSPICFILLTLSASLAEATEMIRGPKIDPEQIERVVACEEAELKQLRNYMADLLATETYASNFQTEKKLCHYHPDFGCILRVHGTRRLSELKVKGPQYIVMNLNDKDELLVQVDYGAWEDDLG